MGGQHQTRGPISHRSGDHNLSYRLLQGQHMFRGHHRLHFWWHVPGGPPSNGRERLGIRRGNANHRQETIQLGFGQRPRAFLFDGILRGQHMEGLGQWAGHPRRRDRALLHRFKHG